MRITSMSKARRCFKAMRKYISNLRQCCFYDQVIARRPQNESLILKGIEQALRQDKYSGMKKNLWERKPKLNFRDVFIVKQIKSLYDEIVRIEEYVYFGITPILNGDIKAEHRRLKNFVSRLLPVSEAAFA